MSMFRTPCADNQHGEAGVPSDRWKRPRCTECGFDLDDDALRARGVTVHYEGDVERFEWAAGR